MPPTARIFKADDLRKLGLAINSAHYCTAWVTFHLDRGSPASDVYNCAKRTAHYGRCALAVAQTLYIRLV